MATPAPVLGGHERAQIEAALQAAHSENTRRVYGSQWRRFAKFCAARGEEALPAHPVTVAAYLTQRVEDGAGIATLRQAAIVHVHVAGAGVRQVLSGLAREHGAPARQAQGLTREGLAAIRASAHRPRRGRRGRATAALANLLHGL
ncbi:MAG: hypothetical protein OXL33_00465 [Chloroflexota bacterium]|nr:hypothetical protein [Chloroflexota bacterium]